MTCGSRIPTLIHDPPSLIYWILKKFYFSNFDVVSKTNVLTILKDEKF